MGLVTIGIFAFNAQAMEGAYFQMISHGLVSAALFLCVGVLYDRLHTKKISSFGGLAARMPKYALVFMLFTLAAVGLPGTSGFVGEFLVIVGAYKVNTAVAGLAATGLVLGAAYMLWLYWRVMFGALKKEALKNVLDINVREVLIFVPIIALVIYLGVYPNALLKPLEPSIVHLIGQMER